MQMKLIAVGRMKKGPARTLCEEYLKRLEGFGRPLALDWRGTIELDESRARDAARRKSEEAAAISSRVPASGGRVVVLDERGKNLHSTAFADLLRDWRDGGIAETCFVIGGPDGLAPDLSACAHARLAFGAQTWPHQLVRVMLAEQLYRAATIIAGHPYHRA